MRLLVILLAMSLPAAAALVLPEPAPVDEYRVHPDGGLVYDPLRREAQNTGQLKRYVHPQTTKRELSLGGYKLSFAVPKKATAYDVVPISYTLSGNGKRPVAVEATAFEDEKRRKGRDLFDLALPGRLGLKVEYLGSITAHFRPEDKHYLKPDMTDKPGKYPAFRRKQFTRSGVVESGDLVWLKFRYTNTGDTILDPEGIGGCLWYPELHRKNAKGEWEFWGRPYNLYIRDLEYLYPGESREVWVHFCKWPYQISVGPEPGEYLVKMRMVYRWYKDFDAFINIWDGPPMFEYQQPIRFEAKARMAPVEPGMVTLVDGVDAADVVDGSTSDKITRWLHTHEEFMTAFDCHLKGAESRELRAESGKGMLHLQVAPWTKQVVMKLICTDPVAIRAVAVPIEVESDSLSVRFNPKHEVTVVKSGLREPVIWSQCMADMRTNVQLGPFPEVHIRERMREMMECGINVVAFTSMPWLYDDMHNPKSNPQGDAWKYFLDCARKEGVLAEGWGSYPYDRSSIQEISNWINGTDVRMDTTMISGYPAISHADPNLPAANASAWLYQFRRWGDLYYQLEGGEVPIGIEDTRGWMRQDIHIRYQVGDRTIKAFQEWVKAKYGTIGVANAAWGSSYSSFDEVNPEADQVLNAFGQKWEYTDPKHPFHDWSPAIADWDLFRTELRVKNYTDTLDIVRREIPGVKFLLRTEGGNVIVDGIDPESPNSHLRHIYYSQRRCGAIAEVLRKSGVVRFHSDYTTMPYTPTELRSLTRAAVEQGIIPIYLAQFDNMRDIAINSTYGTDYQVHYNLPEPRKGQMMHCLTALFPWFRAVYEEGGVPGILWEDYQCDGFATETQKREMRFFRAKLQEAMSTPEARKARAAGAKTPDQEWRRRSKAIGSYEVR